MPETAKLRFAWLAGSIVPELATVCWMVPVVTGTVTVVTERPAAVDEPDVSQRGSATAAAIEDDRDADDGPPVPTPHRRRLGREDVLVVERQFLGQIHWAFRRVDRSRFHHAPSSDRRFHSRAESQL